MDFSKKLLERTGKPYLSYSAIKYAADGGKQQDMKLFEMYMKGLLKKESDALRFGSLYDTMLLEPENLHERFYLLDDSVIIEELKDKYKNPKASKAYKDWKIAQDSGDKVEVSENDWQMAHDMIKRLKESEVTCGESGEVRSVKSYLSGEAQVEFHDWIQEIPVRGFYDILGEDFVTDSKSTRSVYGFRYDVKSFDYDIQAYIYTEVSKKDKFYWVAQGKTKPYLCAVYKASDYIIESGKKKFWSAVKNISEWLDNPEKDTSSFAMYGEI